MTFLVTTFILGVINIFLAGVASAFSFLRKKQGENLSYKDYLFIIVPICIGIYLLGDIIYELDKLNQNCVTLPDDFCDYCD